MIQDLSSVQESSSGSIEDIKRIKSGTAHAESWCLNLNPQGCTIIILIVLSPALEDLLKGSESASALERGLSDVLPHPQRDSQQ